VPLPPLSPGAMVSEMAFDPLGASVVVLGAVGYAVGVRRLADRGRAWPLGRSMAFAAALVAFAVATMSGLAAYDTVQFSAHMAQHLLLGMIVPVLLVVALPVTLILQAGSRATQVTTLRVLHHPVVAFLTEPIVAFVAFLSDARNPSFGSFTKSPFTVTVNCWLVTPGANVNVPAAAV